MAILYRTFEEAMPVLVALAEKVKQVAEEVGGSVGSYIVRFLRPADVGLTDWVVNLPAGQNEVEYFTIAPGNGNSMLAVGVGGFILEYEDPNAHVRFIYGVLPSGTRVKMIPICYIKDGSDKGRAIFLPADDVHCWGSFIVKKPSTMKITIEYTNDTTVSVKARIVPIAFVGEPAGEFLGSK